MSTEKYSHGRGGIGNIGADQISYVDGLAYSPPVLSVPLLFSAMLTIRKTVIQNSPPAEAEPGIS